MFIATEFDRTGNGDVNKFVYDIEREGLQKSDNIISVSGFTKNMLVEHYNVSPEKVSVVHNGIDHNEYKLPSSMKARLCKLKKKG